MIFLFIATFAISDQRFFTYVKSCGPDCSSNFVFMFTNHINQALENNALFVSSKLFYSPYFSRTEYWLFYKPIKLLALEIGSSLLNKQFIFCNHECKIYFAFYS